MTQTQNTSQQNKSTLPKGWKEVSLGDVIDTANTGLDAIKRAPIVNENTGIKCFRIQDASQSKKYEDWGFTKVNDTNFEKFKLIKGDILIARTGNSIGVNFLVKENTKAVFNNGLIRLRVNSKIKYDFLYNIISSKIFNRYVQSIAYGTSTQPNMQINSLLNFEISLPPLLQQKSIAKILSSFDDKIELLREQNETLEGIGQEIFKEWFGKYKIGDELPEGWRVGKLKDLVNNIKNTLKPGKDLIGRKYIPIDEIPMKRFGLDSFKPIEDAKSSLIGFEEGDILFGAMRSYFHRVNFSTIKGVTRSTVLVLRPHVQDFFSYALMLMNLEESVAYANQHGKGTTMPYAVWNNSLENMPIVIPEKKVMKEFNDLILPLLNKIPINIEQIQELEKTRDLLLPKLMKGEILVDG